MKKILFALLLFSHSALAQNPTLTVEKIMQDPKWIGTSPNDIHWSYNSQSVYFKWNPEKATSDSPYAFTMGEKQPVKMHFTEAQMARALSEGIYDNSRSRIAYSYLGDIFMFTIATNKTIRITNTQEEKTDLVFCNHDKWISYQSNGNLFVWDIAKASRDNLPILSAMIHLLQKNITNRNNG